MPKLAKRDFAPGTRGNDYFLCLDGSVIRGNLVAISGCTFLETVHHRVCHYLGAKLHSPVCKGARCYRWFCVPAFGLKDDQRINGRVQVRLDFLSVVLVDLLGGYTGSRGASASLLQALFLLRRHRKQKGRSFEIRLKYRYQSRNHS